MPAFFLLGGDLKVKRMSLFCGFPVRFSYLTVGITKDLLY